ncbi:hypothetical protein DICSQDRAFT_165694 [Dichomitus squalens LYAD-421 SS1]|uniref:uncharacterized protein n=1 Tax=Dichomitus squalens (strain LYAD-421) TaxID=732165 RepID=UPI0004413468|nr:uncharacterized protein DICSQDRAFT_165694 [Dichomitus squalens LYAD-421 SS1]EJF65988.1 hypothetical protein DICSQDRAFT_165694 [Dichomitus squalens LYAD-421 SS1]
MSAPQSAADFVSAVRLDSSLTLAAFSILYYDYALTITSEIEYYWNPPSMSAPFVLFVVSRYLGLLGPLPVFFEYFGGFPEHAAILTSHSSLSINTPLGFKFPGCDLSLTDEQGTRMSIPQVAVSAETFASSVQFDTCITLAAFTLLYYDYALTVTSEIDWYWNPPSPSVPFVLFTVSRYFGLLGPIPVFLEYFGHIPEHAAVLTSVSPLSTSTLLNFGITGCNLSLNTEQGIHLALAWSAMLWFDTAIFALTFYKAMQVRHYMPGMLLVTMFRDGTIYYGILIVVNTLNITTFLIVPIQAYHAYFTVASQVVVGLLLVIRTYALYNGSKALLATFCAFGIVMFAATLVAMTVMVPPEPPAKILPQALGCDLSVSLPVAILGWIAMVCFDTMIFVLTVAKAFRMAPFWHHRLLSILFRDGAVYYIIMGLVNSGNLLTLVLPSIGDTNRGFLTSLTNAICTTITSRMLLNLRDPELQGGTLRVGRWSISRTSQVAVAGSTASSEAKTAQAAASDCGPVCNHTTILVEPQPTGRVEV